MMVCVRVNLMSGSNPSATAKSAVQTKRKPSREIDASLTDSKITARFAEVGSVPKSMTPADFGKFIVEDTEKWGTVIRVANIKPQ